MTQLKPCPCGKVPEKLHVTAEHDNPKWAFVAGDCCGSWATEFRNDNLSLTSDESIARAKSEWNDAPRGFTQPLGPLNGYTGCIVCGSIYGHGGLQCPSYQVTTGSQS